jgi:molecular chaperone DnaK (HSP70)
LLDADLTTDQIDEVVLVGGSSRIPFVQTQVAEFFGKPTHCELNPDEVVAMGAAVQANILKGELRQLLLLDITPLSLGLETMGGAVSRLIPRNSTIPSRVTERYTTFVDNQTGVDLHIVQGERELAQDCRSLGKFKLSGIPPMPAGIPQIDVTFLIDANGMLQVSAKELKSGQATTIEIRPTHGLDRSEIERMIRDSIDKGQEDLATRKLIDLRTKAQSNLMFTQKALANLADRVGDARRQEIAQKSQSLEAALKQDQVAVLQSALDAFDAATLPLAAMMMDDVAAATVAGKKLDEIPL